MLFTVIVIITYQNLESKLKFLINENGVICSKYVVDEDRKILYHMDCDKENQNERLKEIYTHALDRMKSEIKERESLVIEKERFKKKYGPKVRKKIMEEK